MRAWDAIVASRTSDAPLVLEPAPAPRPPTADDAVDRAALHQAWDAMQDTHELFHLLARFNVTRTQALRLGGETRARPVSTTAITQLLHASAAAGDRIMIFVGNRGCIQIFSGNVVRIVEHGPWLNVLDPAFNLHLRSDRVAASWVVAKPTSTGIVSSLELFDRAGETIALVFRKRADRDRAEDPVWRDRLASLPESSRDPRIRGPGGGSAPSRSSCSARVWCSRVRARVTRRGVRARTGSSRSVVP